VNFQALDLTSDVTPPGNKVKTFAMNGRNFRVSKMSFRHQIGTLWLSIQLSGKIKAAQTYILKNVSPFKCLQGNSVGPCEPGRNKTNVFYLTKLP